MKRKRGRKRKRKTESKRETRIAMSVVLGRRERKKGRERRSEESERRKRRWIEGYGEKGQREEIHAWRGKEERERLREVEFPRSFTRGSQLRMRASLCSKSQNVCNTHAY
jgi:hypothetical protein